MNICEIHSKTIFVSPLDWGMGHATRCVPLIRILLQNNNKVIIGTSEKTKELFEDEFPDLIKVNLPSYNIKYSGFWPAWIKVLFQYPKIIKVINEEYKKLQSFIKEYSIDVVISDNRYGLYSSKIPSFVICHQLNVISPFLVGIANRINIFYLKRFNEIWVPDYPEKERRLSGALSDNRYSLSVNYIGPLSRLIKTPTNEEFDYLIILSGPEPNQRLLLDKIIKKANHFDANKTIKIITSSRFTVQPVRTEVYYLPKAEIISELISKSKCIICRSGYSTLMDIDFMGKKQVILIPTPGQPEQEYLAQYWKNKFGAKVLKESELTKFKF